MPVRILLSDALQYENQRKKLAAEHKRKRDLRGDEFLSGFAKTDRLYPVLTAVIYYGEDMDKKLDAEMVKYIAAFVKSEKIWKLSDKRGEIAMCTALEEMIKEGKEEGKAEGKAESILDLLRELETVPDELEDKIMHETDMEILRGWLKLAARAESVREFQDKMQQGDSFKSYEG